MSLESIVVGDDQTGTTLPGTLHNVTSDNIAGVNFPVGKIILGAIGSNDGPISSANPMPVSGTVTATNVSIVKSSTATITTVADSSSDVLLLAANSNRLGAKITNDSSAILYLSYGTATASSTVYTVQLLQRGTEEVPFNYTGQIRGIWASDPGDGGARITEFTA